jgi:PAS domain S-box-containing protein
LNRKFPSNELGASSDVGGALHVPGSETSRLIRGFDWASTSLGAISTWAASLRSLLGVMLHSRHPMFLWWGPELRQFYNDAYVPSFGNGKHPEAIGQRGSECWQETWHIIGPQIEAVMQRGEPSWNEDALVPIARNGRIEEVYWTYGYSPAFDDQATIAGTLVVCTETTSRVLGARRGDTLRRVTEHFAGCSAEADIVPALIRALSTAKLDVPVTYALTFEQAESVAELADGRASAVVAIEPAPSAWPEPVTHAVAVRCRSLSCYLLFGVSPRLPLDGSYRQLFEQLVEAVEHTTHRLAAFRARATAERERRNLIMQAPIAAALVTGPRHVYELTNPAYDKMIGHRQVIGKAYVDAFPEVSGTEIERIMNRVYETGEAYLAEEYAVPLDSNGDGKLIDAYFRFNLEPIRDDQGSIYAVMAIVLDITGEVHARRVVEKAAAERERLLTQLEAASQAKDEFLATVSHELRTPLTSILGWARLLHGNSDPARIQKGLAAIERNARAQAQLIEDILDVSRIVSGKVRLNLRRVTPEAVVQGVLETVRPLAEAKGQSLTLELEPKLPAITADEDRLQQVIWNLLSNAVKFTPERGAISVRAYSGEDAVVVSVTDTGKGIAPAFLPHVFDRFRQDDTSTTKQQAGLGLGLAIVRHLVELHGGGVTASSDGAGRGSTFAVTFPIRASVPPDVATIPPPPEHVSQSGREPFGRLRGIRVLVVDDQEDARDLIATVVEDAGAEVLQARSVAGALSLLAEREIDVVISDIGMPEEDGYSFLRRLRTARSSERQIPAIAVTAFARAEDRLTALRAGFQEHIAKPIDPESLVELVARWVMP